MALAGKAAQRDGWGYGAEHLALTHTAAGVAAFAVARQARRWQASDRPDYHAPDAEPDRDPNQLDPRATNGPEVERRTTEETLIARNNTLTALRLAAKKQIAELESELGAAREELVRRDNENRSLQTSLDLIASEDARLGARLAENVAAVDQGRSDVEQTKAALAVAQAERDEMRFQLERMKAAAAAAEAERDTLASAIDEAKRTRDAEAAALNPYLNVMSSRVAAAERLLEDTRRSLAAKTAENSSLVHENSRLSRGIAEGDAAVEAAYSQHEHMKTLLGAAIAERDKLTTAFANANDSRQTEVDNLKSRLDAMSSRVATAETLFAGARQSLLEKLEWLQDTLRAKICQVNELKQSHAKLIEDTRILLKSVDARDRSLADANWKIRLLAELVAEPRAAANQQIEVRRTNMLLAGTVAF
jgi:chromosome segregation ATPase